MWTRLFDRCIHLLDQGRKGRFCRNRKSNWKVLSKKGDGIFKGRRRAIMESKSNCHIIQAIETMQTDKNKCEQDSRNRASGGFCNGLRVAQILALEICLIIRVDRPVFVFSLCRKSFRIKDGERCSNFLWK